MKLIDPDDTSYWKVVSPNIDHNILTTTTEQEKVLAYFRQIYCEWLWENDATPLYVKIWLVIKTLFEGFIYSPIVVYISMLVNAADHAVIGIDGVSNKTSGPAHPPSNFDKMVHHYKSVIPLSNISVEAQEITHSVAMMPASSTFNINGFWNHQKREHANPYTPKVINSDEYLPNLITAAAGG